jgi:type I restriction enzyme S subunit
MKELITANLDIWSAAVTAKASGAGRSSGNKGAYGINKLRELILELAVRGKLVPQDPNDEPASELLKRIQQEKQKLFKEGSTKKPKTAAEFNVEITGVLPIGWVYSKLADVAYINPRNIAEDNVSVSFIPMTLVGTLFNGNHDQEVRKWSEVKQGFTHFAEGDIALAKITPCFENSKACVFSGLINGIGAGTTELHVVRPVSGTLNPRYVLAYLKSPRFLLVGESKMTGTAGQKRLPKEFVESNPFPLPPLPEQHRIVAKVDELMVLCDQLEAEQATSADAHEKLVTILLEALTQGDNFPESWARLQDHFDVLFTTPASIDKLKQTLLQLAVMGKLVPQDPNDEPASVLLKKIRREKDRLIAEGKIKKDKPLPPIADKEKPFPLMDGWEWVRLDDLATNSEAGWSPQCAGHPREGDNWGVLKVSAVSWGKYNPDENKELPDGLEARSEYEVKAGDFLISRANTAELVAKAVVVPAGAPKKLMMSDKIIRFKFSEFTNLDFIQLVNNSDHARSYYVAIAGGTSNSMKNVSRVQIRSLVFAMPSESEQHRIVAKVDELMTLCDQLKSKMAEAGEQQRKLADVMVERAVA